MARAGGHGRERQLGRLPEVLLAHLCRGDAETVPASLDYRLHHRPLVLQRAHLRQVQLHAQRCGVHRAQVRGISRSS